MNNNLRYGYMCRIAFDHELGEDACGTLIRADREDVSCCKDKTDDYCDVIKVMIVKSDSYNISAIGKFFWIAWFSFMFLTLTLISAIHAIITWLWPAV